MVVSVVFPNGFGITEDIGVLKYLLETYEIETVKSAPEIGYAYWQCCKIYVDKLIPTPYASTNFSVYLPTMQAVLQRPYFTGEPKVPTQPRFLLAFHLMM